MLYRLVCPVLRFLKRIPHLLPLSLLAVFILVFGPIIYAKIYQNWDTDPDRGAIAIKDGAYGENYSTPRYLEQGWTANDSLWFYNTSQGSGLMPYDLFMVLRQGDLMSCFDPTRTSTSFATCRRKKPSSIPTPCRSAL